MNSQSTVGSLIGVQSVLGKNIQQMLNKTNRTAVYTFRF